MRKRRRSIEAIGLFLGGILLLAPVGGEAGHEPFGTYEDWTTAPTIRADRWLGSGDSGLETRRELNGEKLRMSFRKEGGTVSDAGSTGFFSNRLNLVPPSADQIEADLEIRRLTLTGCIANATATIARAATFDLNRFSDVAGPRPPGDPTGDHIARVQVFRTSDSLDPEGVLTVSAVLFRCNNAPCSATTIVAGPIVLGQVAVRERFLPRLIWDSANNQFLAGLDSNPDVPLPYPAAANVQPANVPFALIRIQHLPANCTIASGGPTVGDAEIQVREVHTNLSAIVP
ncbi:MAG: hypothetical protein HYY64_09895 [Candidatus Rokubacteria bacterium]|nr:hypothetical protein [Candidatus Rokubacteria bacterium]